MARLELIVRGESRKKLSTWFDAMSKREGCESNTRSLVTLGSKDFQALSHRLNVKKMVVLRARSCKTRYMDMSRRSTFQSHPEKCKITWWKQKLRNCPNSASASCQVSDTSVLVHRGRTKELNPITFSRLTSTFANFFGRRKIFKVKKWVTKNLLNFPSPLPPVGQDDVHECSQEKLENSSYSKKRIRIGLSSFVLQNDGMQDVLMKGTWPVEKHTFTHVNAHVRYFPSLHYKDVSLGRIISSRIIWLRPLWDDENIEKSPMSEKIYLWSPSSHFH